MQTEKVEIISVILYNLLMDERTWIDSTMSELILHSGSHSGVESIITLQVQYVHVRDQCFHQLMATGLNT